MIRPATPEDAAHIAAIEAGAAFHPWSASAVRASLEASVGFGWVVDQNGPIAHVLANAVAGEGEILTLAVLPAHQRQGHARTLLAACARTWASRQVDRCFLEVRATNHPARALYAALGWTPASERTDYYGPGEHALVLTWSAP